MKKATKEFIEACKNSAGDPEKNWGILVTGGWTKQTMWWFMGPDDVIFEAHKTGIYQVYDTRKDFDDVFEEFPIPAEFPVVEISYNHANGGVEILPLSKSPSEFEWAMRVLNDDAPANWSKWFDTEAEALAEFPWIELDDYERRRLGEGL